MVSVYGAWALVVSNKCMKEENPPLPSSLIYHFFLFPLFLALFFLFSFIFQLSLFFFYSKIELTSSSSFLCMELLGFSPSFPCTWTFVKKSNVQCQGSLFECVPSPKNIDVYGWCSSSCSQVLYVPSSWSLSKKVIYQEYLKIHTNLTTCSCFYWRRKVFFSWRQMWAKESVNFYLPLYTWVLLTGSMWMELQSCCSGCMIAYGLTLVSHKARPHTTSVYGPLALVVAKV